MLLEIKEHFTKIKLREDKKLIQGFNKRCGGKDSDAEV